MWRGHCDPMQSDRMFINVFLDWKLSQAFSYASFRRYLETDIIPLFSFTDPYRRRNMDCYCSVCFNLHCSNTYYVDRGSVLERSINGPDHIVLRFLMSRVGWQLVWDGPSRFWRWQKNIRKTGRRKTENGPKWRGEIGYN